MDLSNSEGVQPQNPDHLIQTTDIPCEKHLDQMITKICKHSDCRTQNPFCSVCLLDHDVMHFSFLEDIDTVLNPQKISKIKELTQILRVRVEQDSKESGTAFNSNLVIANFRKNIDLNKAKLKECLLNNIISNNDDELKLELKMISDRIYRKFALMAGTKGEETDLIRDYLLTYALGSSRISEIRELIRNQTAITKTQTSAKNYLLGVQKILESVRSFASPIIGELPPYRPFKTNTTRKRREGSELKDEQLSRLEDSLNLADNENDCKFSDSTPRRSTSQKRRRGFLTNGKETKPYKKIKYNPDRKPRSSTGGEMNSNCKVSEVDQSSNTIQAPSAEQMKEEAVEEPVEEKNENDSQDDSDDKARRDYRTCRYPKPVKNLLRLLFSLRINRKYIPEEINVSKLSVRRISKKELKKAIDIISQIYRILTNSSNPIPDSDAQVQKLSKSLYDVIPFNETHTLNDIQKLKKLVPVIESLCALRVTLNMMLGPKEDPNRLKNHYRKLGCQIEELSTEVKEYGLIEGYFKKTAPYNKVYDKGKIEEVLVQSMLKINRDQGQEKDYPKEIHNKRLLWCGFRFTDVVKILRHGFHPIAGFPEELYESKPHVKFFDMVSNALIHCQTTPENSIALLLLCEVALGDVSRKDGKPPDNNLESNQFIEIEDGVKIPIKDPGPDVK